jgi:hypothetical protein
MWGVEPMACPGERAAEGPRPATPLRATGPRWAAHPRANARTTPSETVDVTFRDDGCGPREPAAAGQRHHRIDTVHRITRGCRVWLLVMPSVDLDLRSHGGARPSRTLGRRADRSESDDPHTPPGLAPLVFRATDLSATVAVAGAIAPSRPSPAATTTSTALSAQRSPFRRDDLLRSPLPETATRPPSVPACHRRSSFRPRGVPPPRRFPPPERCVCVATRCRP